MGKRAIVMRVNLFQALADLFLEIIVQDENLKKENPFKTILYL